MRREYELLEDATVIRRFNKIKFPPEGLAGGNAGSAARFVVRLGSDEEIETSASARFELKAGERFLLQSAGGGGYGDPVKRDAAAIARDIAEGYVIARRRQNRRPLNRRANGKQIAKRRPAGSRSGRHSEPTCR